MSKRGALDAFFQPNKKPKVAELPRPPSFIETSDSIASHAQADSTTKSSPKHENDDNSDPPHEPFSTHYTYPFPVPSLPTSLHTELSTCPPKPARHIASHPDLDLLYYEPFLPRPAAKSLFNHLRSSLFFYRVTYPIKRGPVETIINTPRYTTVFGVDETSTFSSPPDPKPDNNNTFTSDSKTPHKPNDLPLSTSTSPILHDTQTRTPIPRTTLQKKYKHPQSPRPIPSPLTALQRITEAITGETFNICLVNYYATGADSISYHSDDERFLGPDPAIASFSLGARRDFLMKHKPRAVAANAGDGSAVNTDNEKEKQQKDKEPSIKLPLASGDMILMRGRTQANWLHSIPKRSGKNCEADGGRINITFRRAMVPAGTDNYYRYNVGSGPVYVWNGARREMVLWGGEQKGGDGGGDVSGK